MTLDELRRHLDELDRRLLQTIAERQATSREIARVKRATGYPTRDYARERDVIVGARSNAQQIGVSPDVAETVVRLLIRSSLATQEQASVAAHGSGSGRRALVIGGAGKMGGWFSQFLRSQGFDVEVADPKAAASGVKTIGLNRHCAPGWKHCARPESRSLHYIRCSGRTPNCCRAGT
jgi:chorismate mutase/prephenate dehydrogenase